MFLFAWALYWMTVAFAYHLTANPPARIILSSKPDGRDIAHEGSGHSPGKKSVHQQNALENRFFSTLLV